MFSGRPELGLVRDRNKKRSQTRTVLGEEGAKRSKSQTNSRSRERRTRWAYLLVGQEDEADTEGLLMHLLPRKGP